MPLCDHVRPGSPHRVDWPTEVHAPILIEIVKSGVREWLASADASVVHEKVDSPEMLDGHRDQVTAALRGGNIAVIRDCLASARPNEVGHLFRYRGVLPRPRYVGPQVVHHNPGAAFGEKFNVCPSQPAACPSHDRDLPLQRNSFGHLAILLRQDSTSRVSISWPIPDVSPRTPSGRKRLISDHRYAVATSTSTLIAVLCKCCLLAQMRSADWVRKCLLFGVDRTYRGHHETDANGLADITPANP